LTSLISVGALPSASTRSCSQRKSGAGAAPMAWRPLFIRVTDPVWRRMPTPLHGDRAFECFAQFKPPRGANGRQPRGRYEV
jgi:hypothetical protein